MISLLLSYMTPAPKLPIYPLGISLDALRNRLPGLREDTNPSEWQDCVDYELRNDDFRLTFSVKDDVVKAVIYNTAIYRKLECQRLRKLRFLLTQYEYDSPWGGMIDNGFGFLYQSKDLKRRAAYSYMMDIFSTSYF